MNSKNKQKGITLIGFAVLLGVLGFFIYAGMKLFPSYMEYNGVVKSMKLVQAEAGIENASLEEIRRKLNLQFSLQYVDEANVPPGAITLNTQSGARSLRVAYDRDIPFVYNVDFLVHFDKTVDLHGAAD
jgi:Tfp pilus assembly major pilin PilA